ncbi:aminotransferase class-III [Plectosphaerella plurivora]|uniref:Aminotransferase class-III n=1 Tax=Plectosphaerella plurivora TaxID=936078 RepID=A0A9P9AFI1_9PEZI|nr:aminotransferase class-III [Plectosphaerella plurivora]
MLVLSLRPSPSRALHRSFCLRKRLAATQATRATSAAIAGEERVAQPPPRSAVLHRTLKTPPRSVVSVSDKHITFQDGHQIMDTTCGAAVSCLGLSNNRVKKAMIDQLEKFPYVNSMFFGHPIGEELAAELIRGTGGAMSKAYIMCSGSEAMEAAMKMARQYFIETKQEKRVNFIARHGSYHGITLGALSMSGHKGRRRLFEGMLLPNIHRVSDCNAYRGMKDGQTVEEYVQQLATELDQKFQALGPDTVCAFVAEPVVGATLGAVPAVPGYFKAMKAVCDKYGALLILDEVMSGMGRCGSLHAWEQEGVIPDIQTIAKGLGGGYAPISGMLINHRVADALEQGSGAFSHGHTYQGYPVSCAAALEVQRIIREENLVENVKETGELLGNLLHKHLDGHPNVGDVRGKGLMWGIEFVADKAVKEPFPLETGVANRLHVKGLELGISLYPGTGTKDGVVGDHVLVAPAYTSTKEEIHDIVAKVQEVIEETFQELPI